MRLVFRVPKRRDIDGRSANNLLRTAGRKADRETAIGRL
jgi:hypothetical protein